MPEQFARAGDGDVIAAFGVDQRRIVHHLNSSPPGKDHRQVVVGIVAEMNFRAFLHVQVDVAFQMNRAGQPFAPRHKDRAADGGVAGGDGLAESFRVFGCGIIFCAIIRDVEYPAGKDWAH